MRTAGEILRRFDRQPGVILADEVGMGKTFVALAVAASTIEATGGERPVVVMVPASVQDKWPREWDVFRQTCLREGGEWIRATPTAINKPAPFFRLLDDPSHRRQHLIFLTHGALTNALGDPFTRLALVRRALGRKQLAAQRRVFPRWADQVLPGAPQLRNQKLVAELLDANPRYWRPILRRALADPGDEPVPDALLRVITKVDLSPLIEALAHLPLRTSPHVERHLADMRKALSSATQAVWRQCMREMQSELPLLILDEAHHLKNRWTRFASLFEAPEAQKDADVLRGAFGGVFDRMLFLTATPFQLGHHELIEVLRRFTAVRWGDGIARATYEAQIGELERVLTAAQTAALRLDRAWTWVRPTDISAVDSDEWWTASGADGLPESVRSIAAHVEDVGARMREAERLLKPWVIRHVRPDRESRRLVLPGRAIADNSRGMPAGLKVAGPAVLPFLLAARVQALVALDGGSTNLRTRAYFAEGLASSFEAYRDTRLRQQARQMIDDAEAAEVVELPDETRWYLDHLDRALPRDRDSDLREHPKIKATTMKSLDLWRAGEKVVVFCFYVATGRALRAHISRAIQNELLREGAHKLGLNPRQRNAVISELERLGDRFFDPDSPVTKSAGELVRVSFDGLALSDAEREQGIDVVLRFLRTPTFLVRHVDVGAGDQVAALHDAFETKDASGRTLRTKIEAFAQFVAERVPEERAELLVALRSINTGTILTSGDALMEGEVGEKRALIPNVRLANGEVSRAARRRLMLGFNTPFFPEVLISSAVMGEGVDLHLDCRHVIHHDLDWNPSVLEQRTGRLDRLGSKSEVTRQPIVVYEPFLEGTQDEKQYRVVKDRERWFNVVMGEKLELDEASTDRLADRVPLPEGLAKSLALRLELDGG